jgi:hypothetical protein
MDESAKKLLVLSSFRAFVIGFLLTPKKLKKRVSQSMRSPEEETADESGTRERLLLMTRPASAGILSLSA